VLTQSSSSKWRRAILYLAWGEKYTRQACDNARSAKFMGVPLILISDKANQNLIPDDHPFDEIRLIDEFRSYDMLSKSTIFDIAPKEYNSFLYLDTDTVILEDIRFGFEMAEKHGIALCPATSYCLPSHHDFRRVMRAYDMPDASQMQYNAGVHFFVDRPDVEEVYSLYQQLAYKLTEQFDYKNAAGKLADQPFLSFAMELLGFNPYTLSINYCYRGIDAEVICGDVRIWHSHHPVPEGLNDPTAAKWPRQRYFNGMSVPISPLYAQLNKSKAETED